MPVPGPGPWPARGPGRTKFFGRAPGLGPDELNIFGLGPEP